MSIPPFSNGTPLDSIYKKPINQFYAPRDIGNLIAWYDFSQINSSLATNAPIMICPDSSGNGYHMVQIANNSAAAPTKSLYNGMSIGTFTAANSQILQCNIIANEQWPKSTNYFPPISYVLLVRYSATQPGTSTVLPAIGTNNNGNVNVTNGAATVGIVTLFGNNTTSSNNNGPQILDGNWHVIIAVIEDNAASVYVDGYLATTHIPSSTVNSVLCAIGLSTLTLGAVSGTASANIDIAEEIISNNRIAESEVNSITASICAKWGVTLTNQTPSSANGSQSFFSGTTSDGSTTRFWVPTRQVSNPVLVLWSHPQGQNEQIVPGYFAYNLVHACVAQGWYFAASSMGGNNSCGNSTALNALSLLKTYMDTNYGPFSNVALMGASMGGLATFNAITHNTIAGVKGAYVIDAVCSLLWFMCNTTYNASVVSGYSLTTGTISAATAGATTVTSTVSYSAGTICLIDPLGTNPEQFTVGSVSGSGPYTLTIAASGTLGFNHSAGVQISDYGTKTAGSDPLIASNANFSTVNARFMYSTGDITVLDTPNSLAMQTHISPVAVTATTTTHNPSPHLSQGASNPTDVVAFIKQAYGV